MLRRQGAGRELEMSGKTGPQNKNLNVGTTDWRRSPGRDTGKDSGNGKCGDDRGLKHGRDIDQQ